MKLITLTGALLTVTVVIAGTAFAGSGAQPVRPDDRAGLRGVGAAASVADTQPVRPDDRAGVRGVGSTLAAEDAHPVRPDDRAGLGGVGRAEAIAAPSGRPDGRLLPDGADMHGSRPTLVLVDGDGFDWGDATIGAFGAFGFSLLAVGLGLAAWRTRRAGERHATV